MATEFEPDIMIKYYKCNSETYNKAKIIKLQIRLDYKNMGLNMYATSSLTEFSK